MTNKKEHSLKQNAFLLDTRVQFFNRQKDLIFAGFANVSEIKTQLQEKGVSKSGFCMVVNKTIKLICYDFEGLEDAFFFFINSKWFILADSIKNKTWCLREMLIKEHHEWAELQILPAIEARTLTGRSSDELRKEE